MKLLINALNKKLCLLVLCFLGIMPFCSAVPMLISFQGHVLKESRPFEGAGQFKFAIVDQVGTTLWRNDGVVGNGEPAQSLGIQVVRGVFAVTLGDNSITNMAVLNSSLFDQDYISIRIWFDAGNGVFEQLSPDTRITAVGFALKAKTVDELPDGIVTNASLGRELKNAITVNMAKTGITSAQTDAITANTAKTGITSAQANAITVNTAKTGITSAQTDAITANTAKTGITSAQANAITVNTAKTGITSAQTDAITANTAKTGITSTQADAITANTAKVGITPDQATAVTLNTAKVGITPNQADAINANTAKVSITSNQATAIALNTAKVGITPNQVTAIEANTDKVGITQSQIDDIAKNKARIEVVESQGGGAGNSGGGNISQSQKDQIIENTAKVGITANQADAINANTAKVGITPDQATAVTLNTAKVGITANQADAINANTAKVGITPDQATAVTLNTAKLGITKAQSNAINANTAKVASNSAEIAKLNQLVDIFSGGAGIVFAFSNDSDPSLVSPEYTQFKNIEAPPWRNGIANGQPSQRHRHAGDWTGSELLVWGGNLGGNNYSQDGGIYDPAKDVWSQIPTFGSPAARDSHTAVWSGSELIVWGGYGKAGYLATGGGFNPATGNWRTHATLGQPSPRVGHASVLGRKNLLQINEVLGYALKREIFVEPLVQGVVLKKGDKLVFPGGGQLILTTSASIGATVLNGHLSGGDLVDKLKGYIGNQHVITIDHANGYTIARQFSVNALSSPLSSGAVAWFSNGSSVELTQNALLGATQIKGILRNGDLENGDVGRRHLIPIWGGRNSEGLLGDGAVYDPLADTWTAINDSNSPDERTGHTAVWLNEELLVWGGDGEAGVLNTGGRYSFAGNSWAVLPTAGAPSARRGHTAISTSSTMIVWGGETEDTLLGGGAVFDPSGNSGLGSWSTMSTSNAPDARSSHSAVWTGSEMIIYGGETVNAEDNTAAAYNPDTDSWRQLTLEGPPLARKNHLAVWTSEEIIVFGGLLNAKPVGALQRLVPKQNWYLYRKN